MKSCVNWKDISLRLTSFSACRIMIRRGKLGGFRIAVVHTLNYTLNYTLKYTLNYTLNYTLKYTLNYTLNYTLKYTHPIAHTPCDGK